MSDSIRPEPAAPAAAQAPRRLRIIPGCIVCRTCEFMAPGIFEVDEKSLEASVLVEQPEEDRLPEVHEAIRNCPEHVIKYRRSYDD
jgi:ferredoxin